MSTAWECPTLATNSALLCGKMPACRSLPGVACPRWDRPQYTALVIGRLPSNGRRGRHRSGGNPSVPAAAGERCEPGLRSSRVRTALVHVSFALRFALKRPRTPAVGSGIERYRAAEPAENVLLRAGGCRQLPRDA